jgi:hypothetical protein
MQGVVGFLLILLYCLAGSVYGECAWVLWEQVDSQRISKSQVEKKPKQAKWEAKISFPASTQGFAACINLMKQSAIKAQERFGARGGNPVVHYLPSGDNAGEESVFVLTDMGIATYSYRCLSDKINPNK